MKKILLFFCLSLVMASCGDNDDPNPSSEDRQERTVLAFFWADNNLESDLKVNISDMISALQSMTEPATLLVYWDGSPSGRWKVPSIIRYAADGKGKVNGQDSEADTSSNPLDWGEVLKEYPDQISTKKEVMKRVLADMVAAHPSASYGIIFGSHGSGWLPTITGKRSIGQDGALANTALIPELAEALREANRAQKFDFILFDACMMGCAEVCYELRDVTKYCIASVLDVPVGGFPYVLTLPLLYKKDLQNHLPKLCADYINYYDANAWGTIAVVDCAQMEALAEAARSVIVSRRDNLKRVETADLQQYGRISDNFRGYAYDMVQYMEVLNGGEAPAAFMEQFAKTVLHASYTPHVSSYASYYKIDGEHYCGLGMYIPNSLTSSKYTLWNDYFMSSIAWYEVAGWKETWIYWGN